MNLIEAIKTGKPFKRPADKDYYEVNPDGYISPVGAYGKNYVYWALPLTKENVLAEDWEIQEED